MKSPATLLTSLRRESLPLALVGILVVLFQLMGMPTAGVAAPAATSPDGIVLCLGLDGDAEGHSPADHHGSGTCPCGPLCLHALSAAHALTPPEAMLAPTGWNLAERRAVSWWPRRGEIPEAPHLTTRSIRAPPFQAV